jgi:hypothetical protein
MDHFIKVAPSLYPILPLEIGHKNKRVKVLEK